MKRMLWFAATAAALWLLPRLSHPAVDLGKLEPVETVHITAEAGNVAIETDKGKTGYGQTLEQALEDLKRSAGAEVFLETANKILITGDPEQVRGELVETFRPSAVICLTRGEPDLEEATKYLSTHPPDLTLNQWRNGSGYWQVLTLNEGRGKLERLQ